MAMRYSTLGERTDMHGGDPITITFPGGRQGKGNAAHPVVASGTSGVCSSAAPFGLCQAAPLQ